MNLTDLIWIPITLLLGYTLPACYLDIKQREMPVGFWSLLWVVCVPVTALLYLAGIYPFEAIITTIALEIIYFWLLICGFYQGADFMYITGISLFFVTNPLSGHSLMAISYAIMLVTSIIIFAILHQTNLFHKWFVSASLPGFPMMLPISLALVLTVIFG